MSEDKFPGWHGTTILAVRRGGRVVVAGDGQVSVGQTVMKGTARKVRRLSPGGHDVAAIGSGGNFALAAARGLMESDLDAEAVARKAMAIAADICVYTNGNLTVEILG